tara:strand:- start:1624 stop:1857 length:234 start_codon:yes stop_codon:yes gene_type:complete
MKFLVTDIEFDFDDDEANTICNSELDTFFIASESDREEVRDRHLGVWEADDDNDLLDEITASSGWEIKNIYYEIQLK